MLEVLIVHTVVFKKPEMLDDFGFRFDLGGQTLFNEQ